MTDPKAVLFAPNDLSLPRPSFATELTGAARERVQAVLLEGWGRREAGGARVWSPARSAPESWHFRVLTDTGERLLKGRRLGGSHPTGMRREAEWAQRLHPLGLPVPRLYPTLHGEPTFRAGEVEWALYRYEAGDHFTGRGSELESAARCYASLTGAVTGLVDVSAANPATTADFFVRLPGFLRSPELPPGTVVDLLAEHAPRILERIELLEARRRWIEASRMVLHLDYHPANLLMREGRVGCILDFEDFIRYPALAGMGFAAYKLIRQAWVDPETRAREQREPGLVNRWLDAWSGAFPAIAYTAADVGLGASYRVLDLIDFILDRTVHEGDPRYLFDLPKQIFSLLEIDLIFGTPAPQTG